MAALRNLVEIHEQGAMALEWAGGGGRGSDLLALGEEKLDPSRWGGAGPQQVGGCWAPAGGGVLGPSRRGGAGPQQVGGAGPQVGGCWAPTGGVRAGLVYRSIGCSTC